MSTHQKTPTTAGDRTFTFAITLTEAWDGSFLSEDDIAHALSSAFPHLSKNGAAIRLVNLLSVARPPGATPGRTNAREAEAATAPHPARRGDDAVLELPVGSLLWADGGWVVVPGGVAPIAILSERAGAAPPPGEAPATIATAFDLVHTGTGSVPTHGTAQRHVIAWHKARTAPCAYTVAAGRQIYHDGQPFLSVGREGQTDPTVADRATHLLTELLNRSGATPESILADAKGSRR